MCKKQWIEWMDDRPLLFVHYILKINIIFTFKEDWKIVKRLQSYGIRRYDRFGLYSFVYSV